MANAVLDGVDGIMLGAETLRGQYPVEAVTTVLGICRQAEQVFNHKAHFDFLMKQAMLVPPPHRVPPCQQHSSRLVGLSLVHGAVG